VLLLRRVEPCESAKTAEGRRVRKELAIHIVEEDLGVSTRNLNVTNGSKKVPKSDEDHVSFAATKKSCAVPPEISFTVHKNDSSILPLHSSSMDWNTQNDLSIPVTDSEACSTTSLSTASETSSTDSPSTLFKINSESETSAANLLLLLAGQGF
jgi:hypothetical protein